MVGVNEAWAISELVGVGVAVAVAEGVGLAVGLPVGVGVGLPVGVGVGLPVGVGVGDPSVIVKASWVHSSVVGAAASDSSGAVGATACCLN